MAKIPKSSISLTRISPQQALHYLTQLVDLMTLNADGSVKGPLPLFLLLDARLEILASNVAVDPLTDQKDLVRHLIFSAIVRVKKKGADNLQWDDFQRALSEKIGEYLAKPQVRYQLLFPLNLSGDWISNKRWIKVFEVRFQRSSWGRIRRLLGWEGFRQEIEKSVEKSKAKDLFSENYFTPFVLDVAARTREEAFHRGSSYFDLLRATINWITMRAFSRQLVGRPSPFGACLPPPIYGVF